MTSTDKDATTIALAPQALCLGIANEINDLYVCKKDGQITQAEYDTAKSRLLNLYPTAPYGVGEEAKSLKGALNFKALTQVEFDAAKKRLLAFCDDGDAKSASEQD